MIKNNLLKNFLKEEIRLHTSLYKNSSFYSYPLTIMVFFALISSLGIMLYGSLDQKLVGTVLINLFFVGGIMSGAFGLYARDYLERKFGDFGRLFSNTLILPIKLNETFITLAISDMIFYLFWFILPSIFGYGIGIFIMHYNISSIPILLLSTFISFITGLFLMFLLSVLYERSKTVFLIFVAIIIILALNLYFAFNIKELFIQSYFISGNLMDFLYSILILIFLAIFSYLSVGNKYQTKIKKDIKKHSMKFPKKFSYHIFKDYIDLKRTGGLLGKPLFTILIPSILLLIFFSSIKMIAVLNFKTLFFSIVFGTLSTQLLNSLITSDDFRYYRFMPISLREYMNSKINLSYIISISLGIIIILAYAISLNSFNYILQSLIVLIALIIYNFNLSFYLTGLNPNENLMQSKIFLKYFLLFVPALFIIMIVGIFFNSMIFYLIYFIISYLLAKLYFRLGIKKWKNLELN